MPPPELQSARTEKRRTSLVCALLFLVTMALYWTAVHSGFCLLDDGQYVTENPHVIHGVTPAAVKWAFTSNYAANWHPLTWLSHMLDWTFYGDFAGGHHLANIVLHSLNTVLLFLALKSLTRMLWPAAIVAAFFGWHPLHVESVAWIAERKDVLSTFFLLLTLLAYVRHARNSGSKTFYVLALFTFALGLMCKPMLVTLPFLLLLLDFWPLRRLSNVVRLVLEKVPFLVLSIAACVETVIAQHAGDAIRSTAEVPFSVRITNVLTAYSHYVIKTIWPDNLSIYYLLPVRPPVAAAIFAAAFLALSIGLVWHWRKQYPWLLTGWFWFLGTLVPVIGFVQVGSQAMADRYTYVPMIGLLIAVVWSLDAALTAGKIGRIALGVMTAISLGACLMLTHRQLSFWHDNVALFRHAVAVTPDNYFAEYELGVALADADDNPAAIVHHRAALRLNPNYEPAQYRLGIELSGDGNWPEAAVYFAQALERDPGSAELHNDLGVALARQNKTSNALGEFDQAIRLNPDYAKAYLNIGNALAQLDQPRAAWTNYSNAVRLDPQSAEALDRLAHLLAISKDETIRNPPEAVKLAEQANQLTKHRVAAFLSTLAKAEAATGNFAKAVESAESALALARSQHLNDLVRELETDLVAYRKGNNP